VDAIVRGNKRRQVPNTGTVRTLTNETVQSNPDEGVEMGFRMTRARVWSDVIGGEYYMRRNSNPLTATCNRALVWGGGGKMIGSLG
jgi:hypothetical protein